MRTTPTTTTTVSVLCLLLAGNTVHQCHASSASGSSSSSSSLSSDSFVKSKAATAYHMNKEKPIHARYISSPGEGWTMQEIFNLKPVIVRFQDLIDFDPTFDIIPGIQEPMECRPHDGTEPEQLKEMCEAHCMNNGRYCDQSLMIEAMHDNNLHLDNDRLQYFRQVKGYQLVEESARRLCVWDLYGKNDVIKYFQYHEAMKATGCDAVLVDNCVEQAIESCGMDSSKVTKCVQGEHGLGPDVHGNHKLLDAQPIQPLQKNSRQPPAFFVNNQDMEWNDMDTKTALDHVCKNFPDNVPRPAVCEFCQSYCPNTVGSDKFYDDGYKTCLWELKCAGDNNNNSGRTFRDFLASKDTTESEIIKAAASSRGRGGGGGGDSTLSKATSIAATFMAMILTAGVLALTVMAVRIWRTKVIIERYVREQEELSMTRLSGGAAASTGPNGSHRDLAFFPDENELDLDLEPALQYRDHISAPAASGPSRHSFLPKLT